MSKLLIIEDDQTIAKIYRDKLVAMGYQVHVAFDGQAGYEMVHSTKPDLIILDLVLPKLSGVDLLTKIRAESEFEHTPVIVFSNTYLTNLVQQAWKAGATKCLSKVNCSPREVLEVIDKALGKSAPAHSISANETDAVLVAERKRALIKGFPGMLDALRTQHHVLVKAEDETAKAYQMEMLYSGIHALAGNALLAGVPRVAQMAEALEALAEELQDKPEHISASTLRTLALAIDTLSRLSEKSALPDRWEPPPPKILVVDDDVISRRAITHALGQVRLKSLDVGGPKAALFLLGTNHFDLIFLDVDMPDMNGHELCAKIRALPAHRKTPIVFVTGLSDLESRASSMVSGGNDFIAKPFLFTELSMKALIYVYGSKSATSN